MEKDGPSNNRKDLFLSLCLPVAIVGELACSEAIVLMKTRSNYLKYGIMMNGTGSNAVYACVYR